MGPAGLIALVAGWVTTEMGRQPWVIYGLLRTRDAVSLHSTLQMAISLLVFIVVYCAVFGVGYYYIFRLIKKRAAAGDGADLANRRHPGASALSG